MALARSVLVTGSNRGIGLEFIKQLTALEKPPEFIFAACRSPDKAQDLKEIAEEHNNVHMLKLDICNIEEIRSAKEVVAQHVGDFGLNLLINNAAVLYQSRKICDVTVEQLMDSYAVNLIGPTMVVKEFLPLLQQASRHEVAKEMSCSRAAILNLSAKTASIHDNQIGGYYASRIAKVALNMVTKNLSIELIEDKILAVILNPGHVRTDAGGPNAPTAVEDSVAGMLKLAEGFREKDNGLFYGFKGDLIPW
eukprot:gene14985-16531_t